MRIRCVALPLLRDGQTHTTPTQKWNSASRQQQTPGNSPMMSLAVFSLLFFLFYTAHSFCLTPACGASKQQRTRTPRGLSASTETTNTTGLRGLPSNNAFLNSFGDDGIGRARPRPWEESFQLLKDYKKVFKTTRVRIEDDSALAKWVSFHRHQQHSLPQEKIDLLNSIGFEWEKGEERNERSWQEKFERLKNYKSVHGDCLVPQKYAADPALGQWVKTQRDYKKERQMQPEREKQLDQIGFVWRVRLPVDRDNSRNDRRWEQQYNKTVVFKKTHGHCMVPKCYAEDTQLALWVRTQRDVYKRGDMRPDRAHKLNEIGFVWECVVGEDEKSILDLHWGTMLQHLKDFKAEKGHTNVPRSYENFGLGQWVKSQRTLQRQNNLSAIRHQALTEICFQWKLTPWNDRFEQLQVLFEEQGNSSLPTKLDGAFKRWIYKQRYLFRKDCVGVAIGAGMILHRTMSLYYGHRPQRWTYCCNVFPSPVDLAVLKQGTDGGETVPPPFFLPLPMFQVPMGDIRATCFGLGYQPCHEWRVDSLKVVSNTPVNRLSTRSACDMNSAAYWYCYH